MASFRSRAKKAGREAGFFGQLNANIERRKTQAENIERMTKQADLHRANTQFSANLAEQQSRRESLSAIKAHVVDDKISDEGVALWGIQNNPALSKMSPEARNRTLRQLKESMNAGGVNAFIGIEDQSPQVARELRSVDSQVSKAINPLPDVPVASAGPGGASVDIPVSAATTEPAVAATKPTDFSGFFPTAGGVDLKEATGTFLNANKEEVPTTFDPTSGRRFTTDPVTGEKDFNITLEQPKDIEERISGRVVHLRDPDTGDIDTSRSFDVKFNKTTQTTEMEILPGTWIPKPPNTVLADKTKGRGKEAVTGDVEFSDKETTQLQYTGSAISTLDRLAKTSQLRDRGIVAGTQRLYNSFDEMLIANGLKGDNTVSLLQIMAKHDDDALAAGLGETMQLTDDEKIGITTYFRQGKTGPQDAAYMKGAINALKKLVPLQIVRAMSDNPRPSQTLITAVSDIIQGKPIGTELAGAIGEFRRSVVGRERSIYDLKYTPDATPRKLKNAGWLFTGKVFKDENDKFRYAIKHKTGRTTGIPVRMNPTVEQLNAWLNK